MVLKVDEKEIKKDEIKENSIEESKDGNTDNYVVVFKNKTKKRPYQLLKEEDLDDKKDIFIDHNKKLLVVVGRKNIIKKNKEIHEISPNRYIEFFETKHGIAFRPLNKEETIYYKEKIQTHIVLKSKIRKKIK